MQRPTRTPSTASYPTLMFVPVAIETGGTWHRQAVELVQELGRRTANITGDARQKNFLFQQLSVAQQTGNAVSFQNTFTTMQLFHMFNVLVPTGFVLLGQKKNNNNNNNNYYYYCYCAIVIKLNAK